MLSLRQKIFAAYDKYIKDCKAEYGEKFTVEPLTLLDDPRRIEVKPIDPFRLLKTREDYMTAM